MEEGKTAWSERRLQMVGAVAPQGARQCSEPVLVVTKQGDAGIELGRGCEYCSDPAIHNNTPLRAQGGRAETENPPGVKGEPLLEGAEACGASRQASQVCRR